MSRLRRVEQTVVVQDRSFEILQRPSGLEPELVEQDAPSILVCSQRLGLPATAIEGEHQLPSKALAEGMVSDELLELTRRLGVTPAVEVGVQPLLQAFEPQLV